MRASAALDLEEMQSELRATRAKLAEVAAAARTELGGLAPSIPELAREAAEQTRALQQETEQLQRSAAAGEIPDLQPRLDELAAGQVQADQPLQELRDALSELAGAQDLLDQEQRAVARDADTSAKIVDQAAEQVEGAMNNVQQSATPAQAAEPLSRAATAQQRASEALDKIADHFERLQTGALSNDEMADARQSLAQLARDVDMAAMDEWYKTAEMLAELTGMDPEQAIKRLEDELDRNPRMQQELSDISKQALGESLENLKYSAQQERALQAQLEQSDPAFLNRKTLLQQDLQTASERVRQLLQQLTADTGSATSRAGQRELQRQVEELHGRIQTAARQAEQASLASPLEEMQSFGRELAETLQSVQQQLGTAANQLAEESKKEVHPTEQELRNRKREMEDWQRRVLQQQSRGAQAVQRSQDQRLRQAENEVRAAEQQQRNAQRERDEARQRADAKPDDEVLKRQLAEKEARVAAADAAVQRQQEKSQAVQTRLERAKQQAEEIATRKAEDLNTPQPTAELAGRLARSAAETAAAIMQDLEQSLSDSGWTQELAATQNQLQSGRQQQAVVESAVGAVAEDLNRAARHEQRLERPEAAAQIQAQAAQVGATASGEVHAATEQLSSAAQQAAEAATAAGMTPDAGTAPAAASLDARQSVSQAEQSIRQRAQDLESLLAADAGNSPASERSMQPTPAASPSVPLDPKMLARMLDELDRAQNQSSSGQQPQQQPQQQSAAGQQQASQSSPNGQPQDDNNQNSNQPSQSGQNAARDTATMQEAARQLASQMNRERQQGSQSTAASRMPSNAADTRSSPPSAVRVLSVERRSGGDWGKLREQAAEETLESARGSIAPQYRQQVETYFRILSERSQARESR
jgi:hypothetical protein